MSHEVYNLGLCMSLHLHITYEPMEHWEVDENTNVVMFEKTKKITQDHLSM